MLHTGSGGVKNKCNSNKSTQIVQTLPRSKSDPGFKSRFSDKPRSRCLPDRSQHDVGFILLSAQVISPSIIKIGQSHTFRNGDRNGKVIRNSYPGLDHNQKLITSRGSLCGRTHRVWSTSVTMIVHRTTERLITLLRQP